MAQGLPCITAVRHAASPERVPLSGMVVVRDGETIEEEATLSPLAYSIVHRTDLEVFADNEDCGDTIIAALIGAIATDRTLRDVVELAEAGSPVYDTVAPEGTAMVAAASVPVRLMFTVLGDAAG